MSFLYIYNRGLSADKSVRSLSLHFQTALEKTILSIGLSTRYVLHFSAFWCVIIFIKLYSEDTASLLNRRPDPSDLHVGMLYIALPSALISTSTLDALASHDLPSLRNHVREENVTP